MASLKLWVYFVGDAVVIAALYLFLAVARPAVVATPHVVAGRIELGCATAALWNAVVMAINMATNQR